MAGVGSFRPRRPLLGEKYAAMGRGVASPAFFNRKMVLMAVACETPGRRAMSVGGASPLPGRQRIVCSMSRSGQVRDNASMETFLLLEAGPIPRRLLAAKEARVAAFQPVNCASAG